MTCHLAQFSTGELLNMIGAILARPGDGFTDQELDELAAINAEFIRRDLLPCRKTN